MALLLRAMPSQAAALLMPGGRSADVVALSSRLPSDQGEVRGTEGGKKGVEKSRGWSPGPSSDIRHRRPDKLSSAGAQRGVADLPGATIGVKRGENSFYILFSTISHYASVLLCGPLITAPFARSAPLPLPTGHTAEHVQIVLAGGLMGATHAVAVIESSHWWLGVFAAVVLSAGAVCTACRYR